MRNFTEVNYIPILHKHMLNLRKEAFFKEKNETKYKTIRDLLFNYSSTNFNKYDFQF